MSELLRNAESILEAAGAAMSAGEPPSEVAILIDWSGGVRIISGAGWPLESLQAHHGARLAYRVSESRGRVRVEGRSGSLFCVVESGAPAVARAILDGRNFRQPAPLAGRLLPAGGRSVIS